MPPVTQTKDEQIRAEVVTAARGLFQRFGLFKTTMEDIAKATGKGKSTLYYYYASKDEIFDAVIKEDMEDVMGQVQVAVNKAGTAEEKLKTFTLTKLKILAQKATLNSVVFGEISENPQLIKKLKKDYEAQELDLLKNILAFGVAEGEFKKVSDDDLDSMSYIMLSASRGIELATLEECRIKKMGDRLDFILHLLCHGIKN
jgi:AcrR family transcriptional regulator